MGDRWMTDRQVAEALGIGRSTVWLWSKQGLLRPIKIGPRTTRFRVEDVALIGGGETDEN